MGNAAVESHHQLLSTIAVSKEFLGMSYDAIMKMPLKDFYTILRIRAAEEKKKQEYLQQQQQKQMNDIKSSNVSSNKKIPMKSKL